MGEDYHGRPYWSGYVKNFEGIERFEAFKETAYDAPFVVVYEHDALRDDLYGDVDGFLKEYEDALFYEHLDDVNVIAPKDARWVLQQIDLS